MRNRLPLKKGFLSKFYNYCCGFGFYVFRAGQEGDCFISVNTNLAQLLCCDVLVLAKPFQCFKASHILKKVDRLS